MTKTWMRPMRLESHPAFHYHSQKGRIECLEDRLIVTGRLPSFYLKQLAGSASWSDPDNRQSNRRCLLPRLEQYPVRREITPLAIAQTALTQEVQ
jgi:hypothetical protein